MKNLLVMKTLIVHKNAYNTNYFTSENSMISVLSNINIETEQKIFSSYFIR